MKKVLKIITVSLVIVLLILASGLFYFSIKHHRSAHEELVTYLNKQFEGQVTFRDFSLSYLSRFPKIHVEIMDVSILDNDEEILTIGDLDLMLNLRSIWKKELKIDRVILNDISFFAVTDSLGRQPRLLASKSASADSAHQALIINARKIEVRNGLVCFRNDVKKNRTWIKIHKADLKLRSTDSIFTITGSLDGHLDSLISNNSVLFADLPVTGKEIKLDINRKTGVKELTSGYIRSNSVTLTPRLRMEPHEGGQLIELHISGGERFDAILALFRLQFGIDLAQVNPEAKLSLSYNQKGFVNPFKRPYSELDFEITDAVFNGEKLPFPVELVYAKGNYNNGESHSPQTVTLVMDSLYAQVKESHLRGHFSLTNLHDPIIDAYLVSDLDLSHLVKENKNFSLKGMIDLNLSVQGRFSELRKLHMEGKQQARGEINIKNLDLVLKNEGYSLHIENGTTTLNNHIIEISSVAGAFNQSDFHFNGHIENLDQYLLNDNEQLAGKFSLSFDELDVTKLDSKANNKKANKNPAALPLALAKLELDVRGKKVVTPWGDLKNFSSDLLLENELLKINYLRFDYQEGHVESSGQIRFDDSGIVSVNAKLAGDFKKLDFELPASKKYAEKDPPGAFKIPDYIDASVKLKIDQGRIAQIPVSKLAVDASMKGLEIVLHQFRVSAYNGQISTTGKITFDSTGLAGIRLDADMDFDHFKPGEIIAELDLNDRSGKKEKPISIPGMLDVNLDFNAKKVTYKDLTLSNSGFLFHCDQKDATITKLHIDLPFGQLNMEGAIRDYQTDKIHYEAKAVLAIDTLNINDFMEYQFLQALENPDEKPENEGDNKAGSKTGLPGNMELKLEITAEQLVYDSIDVTDLDLVLDYTENKIVLEKLDLGFASGKIHLNGHLNNGNLKSYPGYLYLNTQNLDMKDLLNSFGNFDQEAFTSANSSGKISTASHHYFELSKDLGFNREKNLWLVNTVIHHAAFHQVEPIEKTLFFVGHKAKDTMIISELNINILLVKDKLYFRDILINDNIANLALAGELDLEDKSMDIAAEISLTDLFLRSKKKRVEETQSGIMTLEEDDKLFLRLYGPLADHKLEMFKKRKYDNFQVDLLEEISFAEKEFKKISR